jgi:hypothetical protein
MKGTGLAAALFVTEAYGYAVFTPGNNESIEQGFERIYSLASRVITNFDDLERIANYETQYKLDYEKYQNSLEPLKHDYKQPTNKQEPCVISFYYRDEYSLRDVVENEIFWDGGCKNGYADGLGREIIGADLNLWFLAVYKDGMPTYYIEQNNAYNITFEGVTGTNSVIETGVYTTRYKDFILIKAGVFNVKTNINLFVKDFDKRRDGIRYFVKEYPSSKYQSIDYQYLANSAVEFEFALYDENNIRSGWGISRFKKSYPYITGEYINGKAVAQKLPSRYLEKFKRILDEVTLAEYKAIKAQKNAHKVMEQYQDRICSTGVDIQGLDKAKYQAICVEEFE